MAESFTAAHVNAMIEAAKTSYANCVIGIYDGTKPATAEAAEEATLLCLITKNSGAFTPGSATNGLNFDGPTDGAADGTIEKPSDEVWSGLGLAAAGDDGKTATWFRVYDNSYTTGASSATARWDGTITSTSTNEMKMSSRLIVKDVPVIIQSFSLFLPKS